MNERESPQTPTMYFFFSDPSVRNRGKTNKRNPGTIGFLGENGGLCRRPWMDADLQVPCYNGRFVGTDTV